MNRTATLAAIRVLAALLLASAPGITRAQVRVGSEIPVNSYTPGEQAEPGVAIAEDGSFVVVWTSHDGSFPGVFARRFDAAGGPVGPEIAVNAYTTGIQTGPAVATAADGDFVVFWTGEHNGQGVFGRWFDKVGRPLGDEFRVNEYTTGAKSKPALAADGDGNFVVVWAGAGATDNSGVFGRRVDGRGTPLGAEFAVNTMTTGTQARPSVALTGSGEFVVVFDSNPGGIDVYARRFDALGAPLAPEFRLNSYTTGDQWSPSVAPRTGGGFLAVWHGDGRDGSARGIFARRYTSTASVGAEFVMNTFTTGDQGFARLAAGPSGDAFVAWNGDLEDGSGLGIIGRDYLASAESGPGLVMNSYTTTTQQLPAVARNANGQIVVAWSSLTQDGSGAGVFAQRLLGERIFLDGFHSGTLAAWSASATSGDDVSVVPQAGLGGPSPGLQVVVDELDARYVQDDSPRDEDQYRARFYLDTNGFDPGEAGDRRRVRLLLVFEENPARRICAIVLRRLNGAYSLGGRARRDDNSQQNTGFFPITDGEHMVELAWKRASGPDAEDGAFEMWIDGVSVYATTTLDSSLSSVDMVRLGALNAKVGASGTLYLDEFESRRTRSIGAVPP